VPDVNPLKDTLTSIVWAVVSRITVCAPPWWKMRSSSSLPPWSPAEKAAGSENHFLGPEIKCPPRCAYCPVNRGTPYSSRKLLANAAIAASRVTAYPVHWRSIFRKINVHIHGLATDTPALKIRPTTSSFATTSKSSSFQHGRRPLEQVVFLLIADSFLRRSVVRSLADRPTSPSPRP
jgi:hypothetical protein